MLPPQTIDIDEPTRRTLHEIAQATGESAQTILAHAIEDYRRKRLFDEADAAYTALRRDASAWREEQDERALWANTLQDGVETDEVWTEDGRLVPRG